MIGGGDEADRRLRLLLDKDYDWIENGIFTDEDRSCVGRVMIPEKPIFTA
jgi:hypothetical protein